LNNFARFLLFTKLCCLALEKTSSFFIVWLSSNAYQRSYRVNIAFAATYGF